MINKEEVLYGKLAVMSGFIDEDQFRAAVEEKRKAFEAARAEGDTQGVPALGHFMRSSGLIDDEQHDFLLDKLAAAAPKTLAGYEIVKKLGQGAMGAVYKARQISMDREVALKVLSRELKTNRKFVQRFEREAQMVARLNHPNIVAGIDRGCENGVYYYVMEYVEGNPLDAIVEAAGQLGERRALEITLQMARALEHAASVGMVHRDIKPENILINAEGVAKLCDMGLAKPEDDNAHLTQVGTSMGTPHYISPEQALGRETIDTRSDIYSLGATLWNMLTGDVPFRAESPALVLAAHVDKPLPDPKSVNPMISGPTCHLLRTMLAKDPDDRYANPTALIEAITAILEGRAVEPKPAPTRNRKRPGNARVDSSKQAARGGGRPSSNKVAQSSGGRRRRPSQAGGRAVGRSGARPAGRAPRPAAGNNSTLIGICVGLAVVLVAGLLMLRGKRGGTPEPDPVVSSSASSDDASASAEAELLARLDRELKAIALLTSMPSGYAKAIERFGEVETKYGYHEVCKARIATARAEMMAKAEGEAAKLAKPIDERVSALLEEKLDGPAYDELARFPAEYGFTATGLRLKTQRDKLARALEAAFGELMALADDMVGKSKHKLAIEQLEKAVDRFDVDRRGKIEARVRELKREAEGARAAARKALADDYSRLQSAIDELITERRFGEAKSRIDPLLARVGELADGDDDTLFAPLRLKGWDVERLAGVGAAFAAAGAEVARPAELAADAYLARAIQKRPELGRWHAGVALLHFYERRYPAAQKALGEAEAAGEDMKPLADRLRRAASSAAEEAASKAFAELEAIAAREDWKALGEGIDAFEQAHGETAVAREKAEQLAAWRAKIKAAMAAKPDPEPKPEPKRDLKALLNATKILKWDPRSGQLKLLYEWKKDDELKDWYAGPAPPMMGGGGAGLKIEGGQLTGRARGGFMHKVIWSEKLAVTVRLTANSHRFAGLSLFADGAAKRYFFGFDWSLPFGPAGDQTYIKTFTGNPIAPETVSRSGKVAEDGKTQQLKAVISKGKLQFAVDGKLVASGSDKTRSKGRVGLGSWETARWDKLVIEGTVDKDWLKTFLESGGKDHGKDAEVDWGQLGGGGRR